MSVFYETGQWVWLPSSEEVAIPVKVMNKFQSGSKGTVKSEDGRTIAVSAADSKKMSLANPEVLKPLSDLIELDDLSEEAILHILRERFKRQTIYTNVSQILVSVNPFDRLPNLYSSAVLARYIKDATKQPPHIYRVADASYRRLMEEGQGQSIIISGESGAGKSEATKIMLAYLAEVSNRATGGKSRRSSTTGSAVSSGSLEQQLVQANPVMEAFGNAKTVRNNNSSRFGKLITINVNLSSGAICGGHIVNYLLEKSRVVFQSAGERNYHIFYQVLAGEKGKDEPGIEGGSIKTALRGEDANEGANSNNKEHDPAAAASAEEEQRIDASDGIAYSAADFEEAYGPESSQWFSAELLEVAGGGFELRVDESDGQEYSYNDFVSVYGEGSSEWNTAQVAHPPPPPKPAAATNNLPTPKVSNKTDDAAAASGAGGRPHLGLSKSSAADFSFLNQSNMFHVEGINDEEEWKAVRKCFSTLRFSEDDLVAPLLQCVAAILHLGNTELVAVSEAMQEDKASVSNEAVLKHAALLLGVDEVVLQATLVSKKMIGDILVGYSVEKAQAMKEALCKAIYGNLFQVGFWFSVL